jgi:type IX secretion system PorP/SprF family membrane protein
MKKIILSILGLIACFNASAQQDEQFTMYFFNTLIQNPGYAGSREVISLVGLYRNQWTGIDGAPKTISASIHSPMRNDKVGLGLNIVNDKLGVTNFTRITGDYAYRIPVGTRGGKLAIGLQASMLSLTNNFSELNTLTGNDPGFMQDVKNLWLPNVGAGLYYYTQKAYLGVSMPHMLNFNLDKREIQSKADSAFARQFTHIFATAGYVLPLTKDIKLKPAVLMKYLPGTENRGAPAQFDFNLSALLKEALWVGASYRTGDSFDFILGYQFNRQLRAAVAYDVTNTELRAVSDHSFEIMLGYDFNFDRSRIVTPRYF